MNNVRSLVQAARSSSDPRPYLYSDHMLAELLALHEEMIEQLSLERLGAAGSAGFLTDMIEQHEKTAAALRARLKLQEADLGKNGVMLSSARPVPARQNPPFRRSLNAAANSFAPVPAAIHARNL